MTNFFDFKTWYTEDRQKMGDGFYEAPGKIKILISLGIHATVPQVEITVIQYCVREILLHSTRNKTVVICSERMHAKAISSAEVNIRLVRDCIRTKTPLTVWRWK